MGSEVIHLVVEDDPRSWNDHSRAVSCVDRLGAGDPVASFVGDAEVGGVFAEPSAV